MLALVLAGCTAEFLVGDGTGTTTASPGGPVEGGSGLASSSGSDGHATATHEPVTDGGATSSATTEVGASSTSSSDVTTTGSVESTTTVAETTGDPTGGGSPFSDCFVVGPLDCVDLPQCDLFGGTTCWADPCHPDAPDACSMQDYAGCSEAPIAVCVWDGPMVGGACHFDPCAALAFADCNEQPGCVWDGDMETGTCGFAECPACWELGADACDTTDGCRWFPTQMKCAPDPI